MAENSQDPFAATGQSYAQKLSDFQQARNTYLSQANVNPALNSPMPQVAQDPALSPEAYLRQTEDKFNNSGQWARNPTDAGRPYSFDTGENNKEFNRYADFSMFKKYGYQPFENNENIYHDNQPTLARIANSSSQFFGKIISYTIQTAGFLAGAPVALMANDMSMMTDNFLVKASDALKVFTEDKYPIYKGDQYIKGSIWDKLGSTDWWLDDAMDRAALTASMFIPGVVEAKGLGLAGGAVNEATKLYEGTGLITKALTNTARLAPEEYSTLAKTFLPKLYEAAGGTGVNNVLQTYAKRLTMAELGAWNVIGQSGLNAKETQDGVVRAVSARKALGDPGFKDLTDEEIKRKGAEGAKAAFWETVPLTLAEALWTVPMMYSGLNGLKPVLSKLTTATAEDSFLKAAGKLALVAGFTGLEHGQNESMQVAISRYNEDSQAGKDTRGTLPGIWGDYLDNVNDPNGQNNIALGTIQGILTGLGGKGFGYATSVYEKSNQKPNERPKFTATDIMNSSRFFLRLYNQDLSMRSPDGVVINKDGKPEKNQDKIVDGALSLLGVQIALQDKKDAIERGDHMTASRIDHDTLAGFIYPFFESPDGIAHAQGVLNEQKKAAMMDPDFKSWDEEGNPVTPEQIYTTQLQTIKHLQKVYNTIDQQHADYGDIGFDSKDPVHVQQAPNFIAKHKLALYRIASDQLWFDSQLKKNTAQLTALSARINKPGIADQIDSKGNTVYNPIRDPGTLDEEGYNKHLNNRAPLQNAVEDSREEYKTLTRKSAVKEAFKNWIDTAKKVIAKDQEQKKTKPAPVVPTPEQAPAPVQAAPETPQERKNPDNMSPELKIKLQEKFKQVEAKRKQDGEAVYGSLKNFIANSPEAHDVLDSFYGPQAGTLASILSTPTPTITAPVVQVAPVVNTVEAQKADILRRKDQELDRMPLTTTTEESNVVTAKYDAELAALEKPKEEINPQFKGKILYITAGAGKTHLSRLGTFSDLVDGDDILIEQLKKNTGDLDIDHQNLPDKLLAFFKRDRDSAEKMYQDVWGRMKNLANKGKTIVTGTRRFIPKADYVFKTTNDANLAKRVGEQEVRRYRKGEQDYINQRGTEKVYPMEEQTVKERLQEGVPVSGTFTISHKTDIIEKMTNARNLAELSKLTDRSDIEIINGNVTADEVAEAFNTRRAELLAPVIKATEKELVNMDPKDLEMVTAQDIAPVITKEDEQVARENIAKKPMSMKEKIAARKEGKTGESLEDIPENC